MLRYAEEEEEQPQPQPISSESSSDGAVQQLSAGVASMEVKDVSESEGQAPDSGPGTVSSTPEKQKDSSADGSSVANRSLTQSPEQQPQQQQQQWHYFSIAIAHAIQNARSAQLVSSLYSIRSLLGLQRARVDQSLLDLNRGVVQNYMAQKHAERMQIAQQQAEAQRAAYEYYMYQQQQIQLQQQQLEAQRTLSTSPYPQGPYAPVPDNRLVQPQYSYPAYGSPAPTSHPLPQPGQHRQQPGRSAESSEPRSAFVPAQPQVRERERGRPTATTQDARTISHHQQRPQQPQQQPSAQNVESVATGTTIGTPSSSAVPLDEPSPLPNAPATDSPSDFFTQEASAADVSVSVNPMTASVASPSSAPPTTPPVSGSGRRSRKDHKSVTATTVATTAATSSPYSASEASDSSAMLGSDTRRVGTTKSGGGRHGKRHQNA